MPLGREGNGWYTQDQTLAADGNGNSVPSRGIGWGKSLEVGMSLGCPRGCKEAGWSEGAGEGQAAPVGPLRTL